MQILSLVLGALQLIIDVFSRLLGLSTQLHIDERFEETEVGFDCYTFEVPKGDILFGFKVSSLPLHRDTANQLSLVLSIVNTSQKPINIRQVSWLTRKRKGLPFHVVGEERLPARLEEHVGELQLSLPLDEIWAVSMITSGKVTDTLSSLLYFLDLKSELHFIEVEMSNGKSILHKISKSSREFIEEYINREPDRITKLQQANCYVDGCENRADYIVLLFDHYHNGEVFLEQDFTCPYLCEDHMQENERGRGNAGAGERRYPRGVYDYPYSNQHAAQGFTRYMPIEQMEHLKD